VAAEPLTAEEQAAVVAAMLQLTADGDADGAERLGQLAQNPDELRKVLAAADQGAD
jgi:hypothetical protein